MNQVIHSGKYSPGDRVVIVNKDAVAMTYRADFGDGGGVRFTIAPGSSFEIIVGSRAPQIYLEEVSAPGLRGT